MKSYRDLEMEATAIRHQSLEVLSLINNELHDPKTREHFDPEIYSEVNQIVNRAVDLGLVGEDPLPLDQIEEEIDYSKSE